MEDCIVTTETINGVHHTYYSKDDAIIAEYRRSVDLRDGCEYWYRDGKKHRDDGPAVIRYEYNQIAREWWYRRGKRHRVDGPAWIEYKNGQITREYWYRDGKPHRVDGPAEIDYRNGQIFVECWYRYGKLCPIGLLASVIYQNIVLVHWYYIGHTITRDIDEFRDVVKGDAIRQVLRPLPIPIRDAIIPHYCYQ
jgi:antitoxin component YwqK of YwqJK toxin-antitoxin module